MRHEVVLEVEGLLEPAQELALLQRVRIDREAIYELLDEMRSTIPEEVR